MLRSTLVMSFAAAAVALGLRTVAAAVPSTAEQPAPDAAAIATLVDQLGDPSYRAREAATRALIRIGAPAKAELLNALERPDAEVRYRVRLVLTDVLELDRQQRLNDFIADDTGSRDHDLPGWKRFRREVGDNAAARRLFADMQRSEPALLEAAEQGAEVTAAAFDEHCQMAQDAMRMPLRLGESTMNNGQLATFLFVGADSDVPISTQAAMYITSCCCQQPFQQAATAGEGALPLRKLVSAWVRRDFGSDSSTMFQTINLALQLNIREAIEPAQQIIKDTSGNPKLRQFAVQVIGRFGGPDDVARLEPLLTDDAVCAQQQVPPNANPTQVTEVQVIDTQICDVALAVMLHLTDQKLADYGFTRAQANTTNLFNTNSLGFAQQSDRDAAIAKWRAWRGGHEAPK